MAIRQVPAFEAHRNPHFISPKTLIKKTWYHFGRLGVDVFSKLAFDMDIAGQEKIPSGAKILAANHPSTSDPILLTTLLREQISILILETLFKIPVVGKSLELCGHIRVACEDGKPAMEQAIRVLMSGRTLGIFPEGVISPADGSILHAHTGVARLAIRSGVPVVPVGIALDPRCIKRIHTRIEGNLEVGNWTMHGMYAMTVGEPLVFSGDVEDRKYVRAVTEQIMDRVMVLSWESAARIRAAQKRTVSYPFWMAPIRLPIRLLRGVLGSI